MEDKKALRKSKKNRKPSRLQQMLKRVNRDMYARNLELAETNQALSLLRSIDSIVLGSHDEIEILCQKIAKAIIEQSNYEVAAIFACPLTKDGIYLYGLENSSNSEIELPFKEVKIAQHQGWVVTPAIDASFDLEKNNSHVYKELFGRQFSELMNSVRKMPVKTVIITKLITRHRIVGLLMIGLSRREEELTDKDITSVQRLSEAIGIAIDNKLLYEENQRVLLRLKKTNEKLKALDQTKDEFISMASHQLRTPLTSVKGYMSMVLEGDAGELKQQQRELLTQAFVSSQQMVYLIADLLNVSRLKSGKFVIDAHPTNLADIVEAEVSQLKETAKAKGIELSFHKPKNFPDLMIDETKTRQVIMNFADNAIYYSRQGGKIDIELREDARNIYFTVKDNGLGVPLDEKAKLFSKFYRATNARKARPDGTGLGLFMAKKVIDAQGGNIIFESEENRGSTFGFTLNKKKLAVKS